MNKNLLIAVVILTNIAGCASNPVPGDFYRKVIIDTAGVNMTQYRSDLEECESYAAQVNSANKVMTGAAGGAAIGGMIGAAVGNSNTAQKGAGVGAVSGGARGAYSSYEEKSRVVRNCMLGRGYSVLN